MTILFISRNSLIVVHRNNNASNEVTSKYQEFLICQYNKQCTFECKTILWIVCACLKSLIQKNGKNNYVIELLSFKN